MRIDEQQFSNDSGQFVQRVPAFGLELDEREQQVIDHCGPDLRHDGVFRGAEERRTPMDPSGVWR